MPSVEQKLKQLGIDLPPAPKPVAHYLPAKRIGDLIFVSGQGPVRNGTPVFTGQLGAGVTLGEGYEAARICALNCLAVLKDVVGSLDGIAEIVHLRGFVSSTKGFHRQPEVVDGASTLLIEIFGDRGSHARAALGTNTLPMDIPVEIELVARVSIGELHAR